MLSDLVKSVPLTILRVLYLADQVACRIGESIVMVVNHSVR